MKRKFLGMLVKKGEKSYTCSTNIIPSLIADVFSNRFLAFPYTHGAWRVSHKREAQTSLLFMPLRKVLYSPLRR